MIELNFKVKVGLKFLSFNSKLFYVVSIILFTDRGNIRFTLISIYIGRI